MSEANFYTMFTDRHRGPREMVKSRLATSYLPFIEPLKQLYAECPALDLGCGRGEWLELLQEHGFKPHGIDLDEGMLADCRERGFSVEKQDAASAFVALADESQVVVSGFHIVEHIPFEALQTLASEALRVLKPGGLMILETPNPENILVSTSGFFLDPTHERPIPLHLLAFVAEYYGFARIKVLRLHESAEITTKSVVSLLDVLGGASPDYAIVAQKSCNEDQMAITGQPFTLEKGLTLDALATQYDRQIESRIRQIESRITQSEARAAKAEMEQQALYASRSWRLTKPLRHFADVTRRMRNDTRVIMGKARQLLMSSITFLLSGALRFTLGNLAIKRRVLSWASKFPRLEARLRRAVASIRQAEFSTQTGARSSLSPQARHIHEELTAAIERHNREHG